MCFMGGDIDYLILNYGGFFCFKVYGKNYYSIGLFLLFDDRRFKFL